MKGVGVPVVQVGEEHSYSLDEAALEAILLRPEVRELPVVVVSLAGAYRGGKSFMLNFFIRYLMAPESAREDGTWLGQGTEPLEGFSWGGGSKRNTTGILLWSEPILTTLPTGEKVAVLLMDTQGTFDHKSIYRKSTIFALSTLLSSVLIYNLPGGNIHEDDLQHLQLFTEYGKMVKDQQGGGTAFQVLQFLVRDWPNSFEYAYGSAGGQAYLDEILNIDPEQPKVLSDLRHHIHTSFERVSCFLMPHPGFKAQKQQFTGCTDELEPDFLKCIRVFANTILCPQSLKIKNINGKPVKARELLTYFRSYVKAFNGNNILTPVTIMQATAQAGLLLALNNARVQYEAGMNAVCAEKAPSMPAKELNDIHLHEKQAALAAFQKIKIMGLNEDIDEHIKKLIKEIDARLPKYLATNNRKIEKLVAEAKKLYDQRMRGINEDRPLCVSPAALKQLHDATIKAALHVYDSKQKTNSLDEDRIALVQYLNEQYTQLMRTNLQNNKLAVLELTSEYRARMDGQCSQSPPPAAAAFHQEHSRALQAALNKLKAKRSTSMPDDAMDTDEFKNDLVQKIMENYEQLCKINDEKLRLLAERQQELERAQALEAEMKRERERARQREEELERERENAQQQEFERAQAIEAEMKRERERARQIKEELERERELTQQQEFERAQAIEAEMKQERERARQIKEELERERELAQQQELERVQALEAEVKREREQARRREEELEREREHAQQQELERAQAREAEIKGELERARQREEDLERERMEAQRRERTLERERDEAHNNLVLERQRLEILKATTTASQCCSPPPVETTDSATAQKDNCLVTNRRKNFPLKSHKCILL